MKPTKTELLDKAIKLCEDDEDTGLCTSCGAEIEGVEPDAEKYDCEVCGDVRCVYGREEILLKYA